MKHIKQLIWIILFVAVGTQHAAAQGISFFQGTFQEALQKAKAENKPLFVDVYTVWCGPCKKMVKEVFPLKDVGDKFNAEFVNCKIDAEKGEGIELAKKYKVNSYPTYLFINGDGVLLYRSLGSMPSEKLISEASVAIIEFKDPKPFAVWQDEYETRKNDKVFLWEYLQKRIKLKLNSGDLLDQYFSVCSKEEVLASELIPNLFQFQNMNLDGPFYTFLLQEKESIIKLFKEKYNKNVYFDQFLVFIAKNDVDRAILKKDEVLLNKIISVLLTSKPDENPIEWREGEAKMRYYTQTNNPVELLKVIDGYAKSVFSYGNRLLSVRDSLASARPEKDSLSANTIVTKPDNLQKSGMIKGSSAATSFAYRIRDIARSIFNVVDDKEELKKALDLVTLADKFSDNFTILEIRAGLLYKMGKTVEALEMEEKARSNFLAAMEKSKIPVSEKVQKRLDDTILLMKEGKPTWQFVNN